MKNLDIFVPTAPDLCTPVSYASPLQLNWKLLNFDLEAEDEASVQISFV